MTQITEAFDELEAAVHEWSARIDNVKALQQTKDELDDLAEELPGVKSKILCPEFTKNGAYESGGWSCSGGQTDLLRVVIHLNDHHKWTREQIADWMDEEVEAGNLNIDFEDNLFGEGNDDTN